MATIESEVSLLQHVIANQHEAAVDLLKAATLLRSQANMKFIEVNDLATSRPITISVADISRIEKNAAGKASVITVNESNFVTVETYEQVRALMLS